MNMQQNLSVTYYEHDILDDLEDEDLAMEAVLFVENSSTEKNVYTQTAPDITQISYTHTQYTVIIPKYVKHSYNI